ncbi:sterol desaturase family protein [Parasphingopyxis algicola]|uniref:sterol desaturase family protein n=1 Tax=Parasphingopyxis algicola TaxID=2026624 RepID=UPI0015A36DE6|nr:sterol desaturase family protein [Parasphingopyxis algicola]QLC27017.1 sterol desaturase family protein [Parasphingopyxis algicola]
MTFKELVVAYFQYPAIIAYLVLSVVSFGVWLWQPATLAQTVVSLAVAVMAYPLAWYLLHRWVLHSQWMYKVKILSPVWKRIHYDHHQDPNHLEVLFGSLSTTLPTIVVILAPIGWLIGGIGGAAAAVGAGLLTTCFYEFCHCVQHLKYKPRNKWLAQMKARHMAHHFHDESGNFGITNFFWDKVFGTFYERPDRKEKSETVFNLGYTPETAERYPWVAELSGGVATGHPTQRAKD